jgi:hypothetical protein
MLQCIEMDQTRNGPELKFMVGPKEMVIQIPYKSCVGIVTIQSTSMVAYVLIN